MSTSQTRVMMIRGRNSRRSGERRIDRKRGPATDAQVATYALIARNPARKRSMQSASTAQNVNTPDTPRMRMRIAMIPRPMDMLKIPGMGAKKVKYLFDNLEISDMETLEQACLENKLAVLDGFGDKTQENILKGIHAVKKYQEKFLYGVRRTQ